MTELDFEIWDVFTTERYAGNPLAVVWGGEDLTTETLQKIAVEFNLSETIFVQAPEDPANTAKVRIFTTERELPFAGHPTVGSSLALHARGRSSDDGMSKSVRLEEGVGLVPVVIDGGRATFTTARPPEKIADLPPTEALAECLGLAPEQIAEGADGAYSAGLEFAIVPVTDRSALAACTYDARAWSRWFKEHPARAVYVVQRESPGRVNARMFTSTLSIGEDPATGSAAAAFGGWVAARAADGRTEITIIQGEDMGRRSEIRLTVDVDGGHPTKTQIGGGAVPVAKGVITA